MLDLKINLDPFVSILAIHDHYEIMDSFFPTEIIMSFSQPEINQLMQTPTQIHLQLFFLINVEIALSSVAERTNCTNTLGIRCFDYSPPSRGVNTH